MCSFCADANDRRGIVGDAGVVKWEADGAAEVCASMVGGVLRGIHEYSRERVDPPQLIVGDLHEDGEERLPDREEIVVRGLSLDGGEGVCVC